MAAFSLLAAYPHSHVKVGRCGPVDVAELTKLHLAHAAHHFSFLEPAQSPPVRKRPDGYRNLRFNSTDSAIAEITRLRGGGYSQLGAWSLPMIANHFVLTFRSPLRQPTDPNPTPEQAAMQAGFIGKIIETGVPPEGMTPPPEWLPVVGCPESEIDTAIADLKELGAYPHSHVQMGSFGPVSIHTVRKLHLRHLSHHLSFLVPGPQA